MHSQIQINLDGPVRRTREFSRALRRCSFRLRDRSRVVAGFNAALGCALLLLAPGVVHRALADEVFLAENEAPAAVFPNADRFERSDVAASTELRQRIETALGRAKPTILEASYPVFTAWQGSEVLGRAVIVEEIGKHRPITMIVGVRPDGEVAGVSVMVYREAYGGQVRSSRFLNQYEGTTEQSPLSAGSDIRNITGATLSVRAVGRGVKKAIAVATGIDVAAAEPIEGSEG